MQTFRYAVDSLRSNGHEVGLELLGSINFGIVDPSSDVDCILIHNCDLHMDDGECPFTCPNVLFETQEIVRAVNFRLSPEKLKVEFLDVINLKYIQIALSEKRFEEEILKRLLFYRTIGRPVNRQFFIEACDILENNSEFIQQAIPWGSEALKGFLNTNQHRFSFSKYNERILSTGLQLPEGLEQELKQYLNS